MGLSPGTLRAEAGPGLSRPVQPSTPCEAALPAQGRGPGVSGGPGGVGGCRGGDDTVTSRSHPRRYPDPTPGVQERTPSPVLTGGNHPRAPPEPPQARRSSRRATSGVSGPGPPLTPPGRGRPAPAGGCREVWEVPRGSGGSQRGPRDRPPTHRRRRSAAVSELSGSRGHGPRAVPAPSAPHAAPIGGKALFVPPITFPPRR